MHNRVIIMLRTSCVIYTLYLAYMIISSWYAKPNLDSYQFRKCSDISMRLVEILPAGHIPQHGV